MFVVLFQSAESAHTNLGTDTEVSESVLPVGEVMVTAGATLGRTTHTTSSDSDMLDFPASAVVGEGISHVIPFMVTMALYVPDP